VNTVLIHPTLPALVSAGIERHIILHAPAHASSCADELTRTDTMTRDIAPATASDHARYVDALFANHPTLVDADNTEAEWETILLFDQ
jgi:WD repeat-containing protein 22